MLIVAGTIDVDPVHRESFLESRRDAVAATLEEPGCKEYAFSADLVDPGRVRVFELWESDVDLDRHLEVLAGRPATEDAPIVGADIQRYEVGRVSPLRG